MRVKKIGSVLGILCLSLLSACATPSTSSSVDAQVAASSSSAAASDLRQAVPRTSNGSEPISEFDQWLAQRGPAILQSFAPEVFPDFTAAQVRNFQIGNSVPVATVPQLKDGKPTAKILPGRIAPLFWESKAVGALYVELDGKEAVDKKVFSDEKLGKIVAEYQPAQIIFFDSRLDSWFIAEDGTVRAACRTAEKIVLGKIPLADFLHQRAQLLAENPKIKEITGESKQFSAGRHALWQLILVGAGALSLVAISLLWLRWEVSYLADRPQGEEAEARREKKVKETTKNRFRRATAPVSLYRADSLQRKKPPPPPPHAATAGDASSGEKSEGNKGKNLESQQKDGEKNDEFFND